jgi:hypothetical protein
VIASLFAYERGEERLVAVIVEASGGEELRILRNHELCFREFCSSRDVLLTRAAAMCRHLVARGWARC